MQTLEGFVCHETTPDSDLSQTDTPVFMGPAHQTDTKFVIVLENNVVMCNIQTVELLFALHYAMNMHYTVHKNRPLYFFELCTTF